MYRNRFRKITLANTSSIHTYLISFGLLSSSLLHPPLGLIFEPLLRARTRSRSSALLALRVVLFFAIAFALLTGLSASTSRDRRPSKDPRRPQFLPDPANFNRTATLALSLA